MVWMMPLDLVAEVTCFFFVLLANSKANFITRSTPLRVKTASCTANSFSVPWNMRPPSWLYSPSVFSRTTQKTIARPVEIGELELEVEAARGGFEHAHALRQNLLADSVPRNESDLVLGHVFPLPAANDVY